MTRTILSLVLCLLGTASVVSAHAQTPDRDHGVALSHEVFQTLGDESIPYRIPAIATAYDGTVIAAADYRYSRVDIGWGRIDLHLRRSLDNGLTWLPIESPTVMTGDGNTAVGHQEAGFGDPCLVGDLDSPRMLLTSCSGTPGFFHGDRNHHQGWASWHSEDNGLTWSQPRYLDEEFIYSRFDRSQYGPIKGWFVGSGRICQSRTVKVGKYRRLYCVGSSYNGSETANWALYSDDFGETWEFLGGCDASPVPKGDEPKAEELPDGNVLLSSRTNGGRLFNIFTFTNAKKAEGSWAAQPVFSGEKNQGVTALQNACNGEVMLVPVTRNADRRPLFLLLQSLPFGPGRTNVGIYYKELASPADYASPEAVAANWTGRYQVSQTGSGYSTFTWQHDNHLGFLYEEETHCGTSGGGYTLIYKNISIDEITSGTYSYREGQKGWSLPKKAGRKTFRLERYGIVPNTGQNMAPLFDRALQTIKRESMGADSVTLLLKPGRYDFHPDGAPSRRLFISNHDQDTPKLLGINLEGWRNTTLEGRGAQLIFHGRMLPIVLTDGVNCSIRNLSIDFENPHITQIEILDNNVDDGIITYKPAPWSHWTIRDSNLVVSGEGWEHVPTYGIAFDRDTRHLVYRTSDIWTAGKGVWMGPDSTVISRWRNSQLTPGTIVAMRPPRRPTPAVFMNRDKQTLLKNVNIHYAEGMGVLAQTCDGITMDGFNVCLRGDKDPRYFTAHADATHFSGCRGHIEAVNSLYEGMMDDAINIHGIYLRVAERIDDHTLVCRYMLGEVFDFDWGFQGDTVQFVQTRTMETADGRYTIRRITELDNAENFRIEFNEPLPADINPDASYGIENLTWTPTVRFAHNTIRNNRARGALFSTPRRTIVEDNLFDHTSGAAILLCGDCNGWYETGACHDVVIRKNRFVNALTNMFQFTNAVISIFPVIPELDKQKQLFHSGIVIEDNDFETFDYPLLYAKSVDGLTFRNNRVRHTGAYPPFHSFHRPITLERVENANIEK